MGACASPSLIMGTVQYQSCNPQSNTIRVTIWATRPKTFHIVLRNREFIFVVMARPLRLDIEGGWYHVINRGLEKRQIFPDDREYAHFLDLLRILPTRFGLKIHTYVLMGNHYHPQVETPKANLSQAIQWLNVSYSTWFNRLHRRVGPLFQGRFKAVLHDHDGSALTINRGRKT